MQYNQSILTFSLAGSNVSFSVLKLITKNLSVNNTYTADLLLKTSHAHDGAAWLNKKASLHVGDSLIFSGLISQVNYKRFDSDGFYYTLALSSPLETMKSSVRSRVFLNQNAKTIIDIVFKSYHIPVSQLEWRLSKSLAKWPSITQYQESDWGFFQRLIARFGLCYVVTLTDPYKLIITDNTSQLDHTKIKRLNYIATQGAASDLHHIYKLTRHYQLQPSLAGVKDYNPKTPQRPILTETGVSDQFEDVSTGREMLYGVNSQNALDAQALAQNQLDSYNTKRKVIDITTNADDLQPGQIVKINDDEQAYRISEVNYVLNESSSERLSTNGVTKRLQAVASLIPADVAIKLAYQSSPKVTITRGVIRGSADQSAVDENGCYTLQYPWADTQYNISAPMRLAQTFTGDEFGQHMPLYGNTLVTVLFNHGDPDQAQITGVIANENNVPTVTCKNKTQHIIRSYLGHELLKDDDAQNKQIKLQTNDNHLYLNMHQKANSSQIELASLNGKMNFTAGKHIRLETEKDLKQVAKNAHKTQITQSHTVQAKGDMTYKSAQNIQFRAQGRIQHQTEKDIKVKAEQHASFVSDSDQTWLANSIQAKASGGATIEAGRCVKLNSKNIEITVGQSKLTISGGNVTIEGKQIKVMGNPGGGGSSKVKAIKLPALDRRRK